MKNFSKIFFVTIFLFMGFWGSIQMSFGENNISKFSEKPISNMSACSDDFIRSLNKDNTVIWVDDPKFPKSPCCIDGRVCQPYPAYKQYVIANPSLQSRYDCEGIAKNCGYTPICQVKVGEALDPTTLCPSCVPYAFSFWAPVYQNNNPPQPPPDPCQGVICPKSHYCRNGTCIFDPCQGVICPKKKFCYDGKCIYPR